VVDRAGGLIKALTPGPSSLAEYRSLPRPARVHHIGACRREALAHRTKSAAKTVGFGMASEYEDRKRLTFEQAEGAEPLPTPLRAKELSPELRSLLWEVIYNSILDSWQSHSVGGSTLNEPWNRIFYKKHVRRDLNPANEFRNDGHLLVKGLQPLFFNGDYLQVLGFVEWVLRRSNCPYGLAEKVESALRRSRAAYSVFEGYIIIPIGSDPERETLARAFADVAASEFHGARAHLRNAGSELTAGNCGPSIRESIHAVEAVARVLAPEAQTLGPALSKLERSVRIHPALAKGFSNLYGFTSDQKGIRHALLDEPVPQVDETDALYMLGSCAAFISYLINKARQAELL
jgi:AbiJ N-terminal domain 4